MTASEYFKQKFGNKLEASDSWVIRFAEEFAEILIKEQKQILSLSSVSDCLMAKTKGALDVESERMTDQRLSAVQQAKSTGKFLAIKGIRDGVTNGHYNST